MGSQPPEIRFPAQIVKVQTLADGGIRLTADLPEGYVLSAARLMECKQRGVPGWLTFEPDWSVVEEGRRGSEWEVAQ